jgi:tetratricopeptide (TPR) repeat protein
MGLHSEAGIDFGAALEIRPKSVEALVNRGLARKEIGRFELAEADLTAALELEPTWSRVYFIRSRVRKLLGDKAGATADVERGLELPPQSEKDWIARGMVVLKSDPDAAYECFERALQLNPLSRSALRNMAHVVSENRRDTVAAMKMLDRIVEISPGELDDVVSRAVLNARSGNWSEATTEIERVLAIRRDGKTVFQAACVYALLAGNEIEGFDQNQQDAAAARAIALVGEAITRDPNWLNIAKADRDLASIRDKKEFQSITRAAYTLQRAVRAANDNAKLQSGDDAND